MAFKATYLSGFCCFHQFGQKMSWAQLMTCVIRLVRANRGVNISPGPTRMRGLNHAGGCCMYIVYTLVSMFTSGNAKASHTAPAELAACLGATEADGALGRPLALYRLDVGLPSTDSGNSLHGSEGGSPRGSAVRRTLHLLAEKIEIGVGGKHEPLIRMGSELCKPFPKRMLGNGIKGNLEHLALVCVEENLKFGHLVYLFETCRGGIRFL